MNCILLFVCTLSPGEICAEGSEVQEHLQLNEFDSGLGYIRLRFRGLGHRLRDTMMLTQRDITVERQGSGCLWAKEEGRG